MCTPSYKILWLESGFFDNIGSIKMASRKSRKKSALQGDKKDDKECLAYKVLSVEKTKELTELDNADDLQIKMADVMGLAEHEVDLQEASMLDYYVSGFWWGKEQGFTLEQLSALFTVSKTLLDNIKEKTMNVVDNLREFKKLFAGIGTEIEASYGSLSCFNVEQAQSISDYFHVSLFQHYKLYEFLFTQPRDEEVIVTDLMVETAEPADMPWPPPLDEGVSEEIHTMYIATPPPTPSPVPVTSPASPIPQADEGEEVGDLGDGDQPSVDKEDDEALVPPTSRESGILSQFSPEEVETIMKSVFNEVLGGLQTDVANRMREKEDSFINKINKLRV